MKILEITQLRSSSKIAPRRTSEVDVRRSAGCDVFHHQTIYLQVLITLNAPLKSSFKQSSQPYFVVIQNPFLLYHI
jgi:hypothetical protein